MKRTLAFGFALSVLTATAAIASPHTATSAVQPVVAQVSTDRAISSVHNDVAISKTFDSVQRKLSSDVYVAENRKEFGSQYQRY